MIKQNKHRKTYSKEIKLEAIKMRLDQGHSEKSVLKALNIPDRSMLRRWLKQFRSNGEAGLEERRGKKSTGRPRKHLSTDEQEPAKRIRRLEMENEVLKKLLELQGRDVLLN